MFGVVDDTTKTKFTNRACAVHCNSLPVVVDKAVVVVVKFPNESLMTLKCGEDKNMVLDPQASVSTTHHNARHIQCIV